MKNKFNILTTLLGLAIGVILTLTFSKVFMTRQFDGDYNRWRKLNLMCVIEYAESENNSVTDLWEYSDTLSEVYSLFSFADTKIQARNIEFKIVEGVLQMTFDLEVYVKAIDETELMQELELNIK